MMPNFFFSTDDLSYNKLATQSTTYINSDSYSAKMAVDRNHKTCMRTEAIGLFNSPDKNMWWKVDLGGIYNIYSINILFQNYTGDGLYYCKRSTHFYTMINMLF